MAGSAFVKAAQTSLDLGSKHEAATQYVDAGNCHRKGDANGKMYSHYALYHTCAVPDFERIFKRQHFYVFFLHFFTII